MTGGHELGNSKKFLSETHDLYDLLKDLALSDFSYLQSAKSARDLGAELVEEQWSGTNANQFKSLSLKAYKALFAQHQIVRDLYIGLKRGRESIDDAQQAYEVADTELQEFRTRLSVGPIAPQGWEHLETLQSVLKERSDALGAEVDNAKRFLNYCSAPLQLNPALEDARSQWKKLGYRKIPEGSEVPSTAVLLGLFGENEVKLWANSLYKGTRWASVPLNSESIFDWVNSNKFKEISKGNFKNLPIVDNFIFKNGGNSVAIGKWLKRLAYVGVAIEITSFAADYQLVKRYVDEFQSQWSDALGADLWDTFFRAKVDKVLIEYVKIHGAKTGAQAFIAISASLKAMAACTAALALPAATGIGAVPSAIICVTVSVAAGSAVTSLSDAALDRFDLQPEDYLPILLDNALNYGYQEMKGYAS